MSQFGQFDGGHVKRRGILATNNVLVTGIRIYFFLGHLVWGICIGTSFWETKAFNRVFQYVFETSLGRILSLMQGSPGFPAIRFIEASHIFKWTTLDLHHHFFGWSEYWECFKTPMFVLTAPLSWCSRRFRRRFPGSLQTTIYFHKPPAWFKGWLWTGILWVWCQWNIHSTHGKAFLVLTCVNHPVLGSWSFWFTYMTVRSIPFLRWLTWLISLGAGGRIKRCRGQFFSLTGDFFSFPTKTLGG